MRQLYAVEYTQATSLPNHRNRLRAYVYAHLDQVTNMVRRYGVDVQVTRISEVFEDKVLEAFRRGDSW